jgi:hypothetical protein
VKRTPARGVKETLKPYAYKRSEGGVTRLMACLLENEPASSWLWRQLKGATPGGAAKASLKRAHTVAVMRHETR